MTIGPTDSELYQLVRRAMTERPDASARARLIYEVTRACYDAIKFHPDVRFDADQEERYSAAKVSDEADAHETRMRRWAHNPAG